MFIQGHRGFRGRFPENSLVAFQHAIQLGVDAIELDVVISKDRKVIISHEPFMCHTLCTHNDGTPILKEEAEKFNIYKMSEAEILKFSFGELDYPKFPEQKKVKSYKLSLGAMCAQLEKGMGDISFPQLTIEVKSNPSTIGLWHPSAKEYAKILLENIEQINEEWPMAIQSFDLNILKELDKLNCPLPLIALSESADLGIDEVCETLEFVPDGYSPFFELITETMVEDCLTLGVDISAWTVNSREDIEKLYAFGVRNFITDYPDLLIR